MGIFSFNYMKEGPGVDKNAKKKKGFFLYIDIVFRKFFKIMKANFLYLLVSLPYLAIVFAFLTSIIMNGLGINTTMEAAGDYSAEELSGIAEVLMRTVITVFIFNFLGSGPASASYAYVSRCFTRGEHTWIGSDGWDKFKENFKQAMLLLILDVVLIFFITNAINFYKVLGNEASGGMETIFRLARYFTIAIAFIYTVIHYYAYQIMVTYVCTFRNLIKNSAIIALAKLPMTVLLTLITGAVYYLAVSYIATVNPFLFVIVYGVLGLTFMRFPIEFYAARVIEKNIRAENKKEDKRRADITYPDAE